MPGPSGESVERLQEALRHLLARTPIRQAIIAVESGDRSFRWIGAEGGTDSGGTPVRADTPFFIASIDKLYNATVAMKLVETGQLELDAPVAAYLQPALTRGLHRLDGVDHSGRITVRHLLGHTSGLADWLEDRPRGGRSLVDRILDEGDRTLEMEEIAALVRDRLRPHFPPQDLSAARQRTRYSDTNFMLLVAIIEAVTGQPLHQVHERLLLRPLDLRHTYFPGDSEPLDPTSPPAALRASGRPIQIPRLLRSIRGIYSTAGDTLAFLRRFVRGDVFRDPTTLAVMQRRWNRFGLPLDRAALRAPGWPVEYGLGIMRFRLPWLFTPVHPMPTVVGHTGSTGCWLFHCPDRDLFLSGSVDEVTAGAAPYRMVPRILEIVRQSTAS